MTIRSVINVTLLVTAAVGLVRLAVRGSPTEPPEPQSPAQWFTAKLHGESGTPMPAENEFPAILILFNTSCPECGSSAPTWMQFQERAPSAHIVGVAAASEKARDVDAFKLQYKIRFPVSRMGDRDAWEMGIGRVTPSYYAVNANRRIVFRHEGGPINDAIADSLLYYWQRMETSTAPQAN